MDWVYSDYDRKLAEDLGSYLGTSPILGALVLQRGYSDPVKARMFLNPKLADLDNPFRLKNLKAAALHIGVNLSAHGAPHARKIRSIRNTLQV